MYAKLYAKHGEIERSALLSAETVSNPPQDDSYPDTAKRHRIRIICTTHMQNRESYTGRPSRLSLTNDSHGSHSPLYCRILHIQYYRNSSPYRWISEHLFHVETIELRIESPERVMAGFVTAGLSLVSKKSAPSATTMNSACASKKHVLSMITKLKVTTFQEKMLFS